MSGQFPIFTREEAEAMIQAIKKSDVEDAETLILKIKILANCLEGSWAPAEAFEQWKK
jgi:hypothetical protein